MAPPRPGVGITSQQFAALQKRLRGAKASPEPVVRSGGRAGCGTPVIVGIDPSLRGTGYGIIRVARPAPQVLAHGTLRCPAGWERSRCLLHITESLRQLLRQHQPTIGVLEGLFYAQNLQTALIMGEARGASLVAAAEAGLAIYEIAPRKVKQAIVGYGAAQKIAVAKMVQRMLHLSETPAPDAADALALALAHAQEIGRHALTLPKRI